jgi:hypothetical protein
MRVERDWLRKLVFEMPDRSNLTERTKRFTQDSPILPEVWLSGGVAYCGTPDARVDLLLTPHKDKTPGILSREILDALKKASNAPELRPRGGRYGPIDRFDDSPLTKPTWTVSVNQTTVAASLTFKELITCVLPLSPWWHRNVIDPRKQPQRKQTKRETQQQRDELAWMARLVGVIARCAERRTGKPAREEARDDDPWVVTQRVSRAEGATVADYREF